MTHPFSLQMVLLPRYGLEPDPDYDPEEDWRDDNEGSDKPMLYSKFFDAMFALPDMWVDSTVPWVSAENAAM
jgi:hypothetical protein